jgi:lipoate-protein ligase A
MACDEAMMDLVAPGCIGLRFYGWDPWCISLGRNQRVPDNLRAQSPPKLTAGVDIVRRPTGGRSVYHGPEITYAFVCSDRVLGGPRASYHRLHAALAHGLTELGVQLDPQQSDKSGPQTDTRSLAPGPMSCFRDPAPGELTAGGRKLVGSAQWRHRNTLLQHGSILLRDRQDQADLLSYGCGDKFIGANSSAIGLKDLLDPIPSTERIVTVLTEAIVTGFGANREPATLEQASVKRLTTRYRSDAWQWRRESYRQELTRIEQFA